MEPKAVVDRVVSLQSFEQFDVISVVDNSAANHELTALADYYGEDRSSSHGL